MGNLLSLSKREAGFPGLKSPGSVIPTIVIFNPNSEVEELDVFAPVKLVNGGEVVTVDVFSSANDTIYGVNSMPNSSNPRPKRGEPFLAVTGSSVDLNVEAIVDAGDEIGYDLTTKKYVKHVPGTTVLVGKTEVQTTVATGTVIDVVIKKLI
jgi:hypothetical protein